MRKKKTFFPEFWQYVIDASSLINIAREKGIRFLEERRGAILISEKIKYEVAEDPRIPKMDRSRQFIIKNQEIASPFKDNEEEEYLRILKQRGIDPGEASAMAIALKRDRTLVIDERNTKATGKAQNHGIKTLSWREFIKSS